MKISWVLVFCVATIFVDYVNSANILVLAFFSTKSHKLTYMPLLEELGNRGHKIKIVSPIKATKEMKNIEEVYTMDIENMFFNGDKFNAFDLKQQGKTIDPMAMLPLVQESCALSLDLPVVRDLLKEKFDLVFIQPMFNECTLPLIYRLQAPFVMFTPISIPSFIVNKVGGYFPPSITPNFVLGYSQEMTFFQRFLNFGMDTIAVELWNYIYDPKIERIYREKLGQDIPSISEIMANASLVLSNGHFSLSGPKNYYPDVVDVGGIHSKKAKPLPKDLEDFIRKGDNGFILFSMGSAIKGDKMPEDKRKMILKVFSKLKQQVLWKWESSMSDLPPNVMTSKWLPQQDLLGHKDIKMFITHCGGGSTEEAIYHGVPLVGLPMFADQPQNARLAKQNGFLVELNWNDLTEGNLEAAIKEILDNPKYRDAVKKLSTLFKDRPSDPLELGVYMIEYVIRHKGAPHLRNAGRKLNVLQYHSIDVISAYLAIISAMLFIIYSILKSVVRIIFCRGERSHKSVSNDKKVK